jgi:hypothetical protein
MESEDTWILLLGPPNYIGLVSREDDSWWELCPVYQHFSNISMSPKGELARHIIVLPLDAALDDPPLLLPKRKFEYVYFATMSDADRQGYMRLIENAKKVQMVERTRRSGIILPGS